MQAHGEIKLLPLSFIKEIHFTRRVNERYVESLAEKIEKIGYKPRPLGVTSGGVLYAGAHRYNAFKKLGINECWMHVCDVASKDKEALRDNEADADSLPQTFVDIAEFVVWPKLDQGTSQQAVADEIGWTRERVSHFAMLRNICEDAWRAIATSVASSATASEDGNAEKKQKAVAMTEFLLRDITALTPDQQMYLVKSLVDGGITKNKFKALAENYKARNQSKAWLTERLGDIDQDLSEKAEHEIDSGRYDETWKKDGAESEKLKKLVESIIEQWQGRHSIKLINGDYYAEVQNIPDCSIDAVITDPPYNISTDRIYRLSAQADWNKNFGDWDNVEHADFLSKMDSWTKDFFRVMKPGASGFMFVGEQYLNISQSLFETAGFEIKGTFFWCRANPGTSVTKADFMPAIDMAIQFVKPGSKRTFNYPGEPESFNYRLFPICGGNERIKDSKGVTLHPTQKPESVIRHLMDLITYPGDLVFDGFMGVGTTGAVAKATGRKFIGVEKDKSFFEAAENRIKGDR